ATRPIDSELQEMSLALEPGGRLDWRVGEKLVASARSPFAGQPVHFVVFGSTERDAQTPAHIESVALTTTACDIPTAWGARDPFLGAPSPNAFEPPSQVVADGEEWFALDGPRGIHLWRRAEPNAKPRDKDLGGAVLAPERITFYADGVSHPELAL